MNKIIKLIIVPFLIFLANVVHAEDVIMYRANQNYVDTMTALQNAVIDHKYTLSRVQRVDIGLNQAGYKTDRYRIVFFGKPDEYKKISEKHPELTAYIPLRIVIYAEGDDTMLVALNPVYYSKIVDNKELNVLYKRWSNDIRSIMNEVRKADE